MNVNSATRKKRSVNPRPRGTRRQKKTQHGLEISGGGLEGHPPQKQLPQSDLVFLLYLFLRLITERSAGSNVPAAGRPDAVVPGYAGPGQRREARRDRRRTTEVQRRGWVLVMRGRRRGRRRLEVACCRGAPPRQLERSGLALPAGLEGPGAARARLPDLTAGPQHILGLAELRPKGRGRR